MHKIVQVNDHFEIHRRVTGYRSMAMGLQIEIDIPLGKILFPESDEWIRGIAMFQTEKEAQDALDNYERIQSPPASQLHRLCH